jgi:nucleoside-diphosphate-sugar epimerase
VKALVTGSNGFLGTALVERLLAHGHRDLRLLVRSGSNRRRLDAVLARYPGTPGEPSPEVVVGSIGTVAEAAKVVQGIELVYHLAASLAGSAADIFLSTCVASKHLLEAIVAEGRKPKIVLVSSFGVYGVAELGRGHVVSEATPLEPHPEKRDYYSQAKLRQERLFHEYAERHGLPLVVLRPGVIYGPGGSAFSARVGLSFPGVFLFLGGDNLLPLSYVDNCAEAIVVAGERPEAVGQVFNVHDDDLVTCREYLRLYRAQVKKLRVLPIPYPVLRVLSVAIERYHEASKGQLPALFTRYKTATTWGGNRFDNGKLRGLGWRPIVSTDEGLRRTLEHLGASER